MHTTTWIHPSTQPAHPVHIGRALMVLVVATLALIVAAMLPTVPQASVPEPGPVTGTTIDAGTVQN